ncbi:hypothetical protein Ancab_008018, partial [Ancistrocladus abbreviatus]
TNPFNASNLSAKSANSNAAASDPKEFNKYNRSLLSILSGGAYSISSHEKVKDELDRAPERFRSGPMPLRIEPDSAEPVSSSDPDIFSKEAEPCLFYKA